MYIVDSLGDYFIEFPKNKLELTLTNEIGVGLCSCKVVKSDKTEIVNSYVISDDILKYVEEIFEYEDINLKK